MQTILRGLRELDGVNGTFLADASGQVLAYDAESIYDAALLSQVSRSIATAIDSVRLLHDDWETITSQFTEGRLLVRSIPTGARKGAPHLTLSLIADSRLNPSFATVAIRVAIGKIKAVVDANGGTLPAAIAGGSMNQIPVGSLATSSATFSASTAGASAAGNTLGSAADVAGSGLSWSGFGGSSTLSASGVAVADAASSAALTGCTKCLAKAVGPMAKVFVKEAVRRVTAGQPFSKVMLSALVTELEKDIEDRADAAEFRKAALKLV